MTGCARGDNGIRTDAHTLPCRAASADVCPRADLNTAAKPRPGRHMDMLRDLAVVFHDRPGVDDHVPADDRAGIDDGTRKDLHPGIERGIARDHSARMDQRERLQTMRECEFEGPLARTIVAGSADAHGKVGNPPSEKFREQFVTTENLHAVKSLAMPVGLGIEDAGRRGDLRQAHEIDNHTSMSATTKDDPLRHFHWSKWVEDENGRREHSMRGLEYFPQHHECLGIGDTDGGATNPGQGPNRARPAWQRVWLGFRGEEIHDLELPVDLRRDIAECIGQEGAMHQRRRLVG